MIDTLILGFYDVEFGNHLGLVRSMGADSGAYRDLNLAFIEVDGRPYRALDILTKLMPPEALKGRSLNNADFLWPTIAYLMNFLKRRGYTSDYVNLPHLNSALLRTKLSSGKVRSVVITTTLYVTPSPILELVKLIRDCDPNVCVIVGGPYIANQASLLRPPVLKSVLKSIGADVYVISQEGEATLLRVLDCLKAGGSFAEVCNLAYRQGSDYLLTPSDDEQNSLDENILDYSMFSRDDIGEFVSVRTAKSCPYACSFCGFPQRAGKYTYLPVPAVKQQLDRIRDVGGVTTVTFLDDTFNVPKKRFKALLRMMIQERYGFAWNCFYRSDQGDQETIDLMAEAGCEGVFLGVESGSDEQLSRMNKTARSKDYSWSIEALRKVKISTYASLVVGFPGETAETVAATRSLIEDAQPDFFRAQLWYADPATPIWEKRNEYSITGGGFNWSHATMDWRTACDIVDEFFLSTSGSTWMPQWGFEQWSTFYLQRLGMTLEQVKGFCGAFNAIVGEKIGTGRREARPESLAALGRYTEELKNVGNR